MRLSALFEEFTQYLKVERGASHRLVAPTGHERLRPFEVSDFMMRPGRVFGHS